MAPKQAIATGYQPNRRKPPRSREQRELPCKLTADELRERGEKLASAELEVEKLKASRKGINGAIADQRAEIERLSRIIDDKVETRMIECEWHDDERQNAVICYRTDTKEQIDARAMSSDELQQPLALGGGEGEADADPLVPMSNAKKGRGRPKGSKNKRHTHDASAANGVSAA